MTSAFVVEVMFMIESRLVLVPGFSGSNLSIQPGDAIALHRPDGSVIDTTILGFEFVNRRAPTFSAPISVSGLKSSDVPRGTRVEVAPHQRAR